MIHHLMYQGFFYDAKLRVARLRQNPAKPGVFFAKEFPETRATYAHIWVSAMVLTGGQDMANFVFDFHGGDHVPTLRPGTEVPQWAKAIFQALAEARAEAREEDRSDEEVELHLLPHGGVEVTTHRHLVVTTTKVVTTKRVVPAS